MIAYLDSSVVVKKYIEEQGSPEVRELWMSAARVSISIIGYAEVISAMARRLRAGAIDIEEHEGMVRTFRREWVLLEVLDVGREMEETIDRLALAHGLRGFDTIHLATALLIQLELGRPILFASADRRLAAAARREGFIVWPAKES